MGETMLCEGNIGSSQRYRDNHYRTFKGYPEVNEEVWKLIQNFKKKPEKLLIFFSEYVTADIEYAAFLMRDILNGVWNARKG